MTKIFITTPWFTPAFRAGSSIQTIANLVKELHEGTEYYIFCSDTDINGAALEDIKADQWNSYNTHTKVWHSGPGKISDNLVKQVEQIKPDIILIVGLFSWHFNMVPLLFCKKPVKILSTRGALHPAASSRGKWRKRVYLRLFRLLEYHYKIHFQATDKDELNFITGYFGKETKVWVAGNFPNKLEYLPVVPKRSGELKLVSIALAGPAKNILSVLEALQKSLNKIEYQIYGAIKDEDYVRLCREKIKSLPSNIQVTWNKEVGPEQVKWVLGDNHVFVLPVKTKSYCYAAFEALSAGRPVITSNNTPWNGLKEGNAGMNVPDHDNVALCDAINFFASLDQPEMEKWSRGAHQYSEDKADIEEIRKQYQQMFEAALA